MEIYIDVLLILNTYLTWLMLSLTAALTHTHSKPKHRAVASFIGGISALMILIPIGVKLIAFAVFVLRILSCVVIVTVGFWKQSAKKYISLSLAFFLISMLLSAATELTQRLLNTSVITLHSGFIYLDISPINLVASTAVIYLLLCKFAKVFDRNLGASRSYRVEIKMGSKVFSLDGIADTGNSAGDLFSGLPVIICTGIEIPMTDKLRAVPYKTISGDGLLYACFPDTVTITGEKGIPHEVSALVASADPNGEQRAIFNPKILT